MLNKRRFGWLAILVMVFGLVISFSGCIILDDDDDDDNDESIYFVNHTVHNGIRCYVDDVFYGTVNGLTTLHVTGDFDGTRVLYAETDDLYWGPSNYVIPEGGTFTWDLDY